MKKIFIISAFITLLLLSSSCTKQEDNNENKKESTQAIIQTTTQTQPQTQTQGHMHVYNLETTLEASCTDKGVITYTCECGDTYTGEIDAKGHSEVVHDAKEATCYEEGYTKSRSCSSCDAILETKTIIPKLKHDIQNGECVMCKAVINDKSDTTDFYSGMMVTKLPYTSNGLTIDSIEFEGTKISINVTNSTGHAITQQSYIPFECYNIAGVVVKTGEIYLTDMEDGKEATVFFHADNRSSKIIFGKAVVKE